MIKPPYLPLFLTQLKPRKGLESLNYQHSVLPWSMLLRYWFLLKENRPSRDYLLPLSSEQLFLNTSAQLSQFIFYLFCYSCVFFTNIALIFLILPFHSLYNISFPSFSLSPTIPFQLYLWVLPFLFNFFFEFYHSFPTFILISTITWINLYSLFGSLFLAL